MRNVAIILAGGIGSRMGLPIPKQFMIIYGKPVIIHTLMNFERNENVDDILIVCEKNWIQFMTDMVKEHGISKVRWIIPGGDTGHDSTRNGVFHLKDILKEGDFVIIHDAARPILPQAAINEMIELAREKGNASLAIPCYETAIYTDDQKSGTEELNREHIMRVQTPQMYEYSKFRSWYERAEEENKHDFVYADILALYYGERVYFSTGFVNNIKITRQEDVPLCEALMGFTEEQLFTKTKK